MKISTDLDLFSLDYLELLPLRPKKKKLEALTSLGSRVIVVNGFASWRDFGKHIGYKPADADRANTKVSDWQRLANLLRISIDELREMTTFYLEEKFQNKQGSTRNNLLYQCFSSYLRYCPKCLAECRIYSLVWAFNMIPGCIRHSCYFLENCPDCGKAIPRMFTHYELGTCPHCQFDLSKSEVILLEPGDYLLAKVRSYDIEKLLLPISFIGNIGIRLKNIRESMNIEFNEVCRVTLWPPWKLRILENGQSVSYLEDYLLYADYLGLTLIQVLQFPEHNVVDKDFEEFFAQRKVQLLSQASEFEQTLIAEANLGLQNLKSEHIKPNQANLMRFINIQYPRFAVFPSIKPLFIEAKLDFKQVETHRKDLEMLEKLKETVEFLRASGYAPFWQEVLSEMGLTVNSLQELPMCLEYSAEVIGYSEECSTMIDRLTKKKIYVHISIIMARTQALIDYVLAKSWKLSGSDIQKEIGFPKGLIARHKPLRELIQSYVEKVAHLKKRRRSRK